MCWCYRVSALGDWESFSPGFAVVFSLDLLLLSCPGDRESVQVILRWKIYNKWENPNPPACVTSEQETCHTAQQKGASDTAFQWLCSSWWLPGLGRSWDTGCVSAVGWVKSLDLLLKEAGAGAWQLAGNAARCDSVRIDWFPQNTSFFMIWHFPVENCLEKSPGQPDLNPTGVLFHSWPFSILDERMIPALIANVWNKICPQTPLGYTFHYPFVKLKKPTVNISPWIRDWCFNHVWICIHLGVPPLWIFLGAAWVIIKLSITVWSVLRAPFMFNPQALLHGKAALGPGCELVATP